MNECEWLADCTFFDERLSDMPAMSFVFKEKYCRGDWSLCARHRVASKYGRDSVPAELFPNQSDKAERFIQQLESV